MFDVEKYYEISHSGDIVPEKVNGEMLDYIKTFAHVVLWGASFLGAALGKYLLENGVTIENYWDLRKDELEQVNGVNVILPFSTEDKENTLVIFCIGNNVIRGSLLNELCQKGYMHVLRGDYLYEGTVCPFNFLTGIDSRICQGSMCCRAMFCQRIENIVQKRHPSKNPLSIFHITLTINQKCSLGCKCCTSYMNEYPKHDRINIPLSRIERDIDTFFGAVDSVGSVTVMGGEPFLHPDISKIIKKLLQKDNIGLICIATTGTCDISDEQLEGLSDKRVNVSFSNYEQSIGEGPKKKMYKNIEKMQQKNISYTVGVHMPEWIVPSTLYSLGETVEEMTQKKQRCHHPPRCMMIKNGKLHPCDFAAAVYGLKIADYTTDYVNLEEVVEPKKLKEDIRNFIDQSYYQVCGHCHIGGMGITSKAAEQGYMDFKKPLFHE